MPERIGLRQPEGLGKWIETTLPNDDGMVYELYEVRGWGNRFYMASYHEAVGLVTWWEVPLEEWERDYFYA